MPSAQQASQPIKTGLAAGTLGATLRMSAQTSADTRKIKKDEEV
jgi:hypothetical protein